MPMPKQKRGESKQDYETPPRLIRAIEERFGKLEVDLAATPDNAKCVRYVTPEEDSLSVDWVARYGDCNCWLNPPFANIEPWAERCRNFAMYAMKGRLFFLTPASIGSNWFSMFVHRYAYVIALNGRPTFVGETTCYPKDCMISVFGAGIQGFETWRWMGGQ